MKIGLIAADFTKVAAAVALGSGIIWKLYLEDRVEVIVAESEARTNHTIVAVCTALAQGDTLSAQALVEFVDNPPAGPGL